MRKLTLKKENLVELSSEELDDVVGGMISGPTCPQCGSDFQQCLTGLRCLSLINC